MPDSAFSPFTEPRAAGTLAVAPPVHTLLFLERHSFIPDADWWWEVRGIGREALGVRFGSLLAPLYGGVATKHDHRLSLRIAVGNSVMHAALQRFSSPPSRLLILRQEPVSALSPLEEREGVVCFAGDAAPAGTPAATILGGCRMKGLVVPPQMRPPTKASLVLGCETRCTSAPGMPALLAAMQVKDGTRHVNASALTSAAALAALGAIDMFDLSFFPAALDLVGRSKGRGARAVLLLAALNAISQTRRVSIGQQFNPYAQKPTAAAESCGARALAYSVACGRPATFFSVLTSSDDAEEYDYFEAHLRLAEEEVEGDDDDDGAARLAHWEAQQRR